VRQSGGLNIQRRKAKGKSQPSYYLEVKQMAERNAIEYTGKVLDQRNNLTGPDDKGKPSYPVRPKHLPIQQPNSNKGK
jgi:hypothetical protein